MDISIIPAIAAIVKERLGVQLVGSSRVGGPRRGIVFWFANYNRGSAPNFFIRPKGLKRHLVSVSFGPYASEVIEHINRTADEDAFIYFESSVEELKEHCRKVTDVNWTELRTKIDAGLKLEFEIDVDEPNSVQSYLETAGLVMLPLVASFAELIGYDENELVDLEDAAVMEGSRYEAHLSKLERNPRTRFLCLSIHGNKCSICGFDPESFYGQDFKRVIEVHHIEPLSELDAPKKYNPKTDLIPLCPNCHRALHKQIPAISPNTLREQIRCLKTS